MEQMEGMSASRLPLDLRVVMVLGVLSCVVYFGAAILLAVGIAHVPVDTPGRAFFGMIVLASDASAMIRELASGLACVVFVYGLRCRSRWAWWYALAYMTYNMADALSILPSYTITAAIAIASAAAITVWLLCRRQLFGIGRETKEWRDGHEGAVEKPWYQM